MPTSSPVPRGAASKLFSPLAIAGGTVTLKHRIVMAPMTRNRGVPLTEGTVECPNRVWVPDELFAEYYGQRATEGGLIVTESVLPSLEAGAMPGVPGMWLSEHLEGWKLVRRSLFKSN
jgi:2,4-dienoyl-CoA reductase-like NADH-dependent reductase (Old Yellow Enzyme family)